MPKETIHTGTTQVHVGWRRDDGVQIATTGNLHTGETNDGVYVDLNRHQLNTLIRHLRRARDAAYGRDE